MNAGFEEHGIFRVSGDKTKMDKVIEEFDKVRNFWR
jgi:hypothetical protein